MAEPRATINPIELKYPMSMAKMEYEIASNGFFEKNTTVRDNTLQCYFGKNEDWYFGTETEKNTSFADDTGVHHIKCDFGLKKNIIYGFDGEQNIKIAVPLGKTRIAMVSGEYIYIYDKIEKEFVHNSARQISDILTIGAFEYEGKGYVVLITRDKKFGVYDVEKNKLIWWGRNSERLADLPYTLPTITDNLFIAVCPKIDNNIVVFSIVSKIKHYTGNEPVSLTLALDMTKATDEYHAQMLYDVWFGGENKRNNDNFAYNGVNWCVATNRFTDNAWVGIEISNCYFEKNETSLVVKIRGYATLRTGQTSSNNTLSIDYGYTEFSYLVENEVGCQFIGFPHYAMGTQYTAEECINYNTMYTLNNGAVVIPFGSRNSFYDAYFTSNALLYNNSQISGVSKAEILLEPLFSIEDARVDKDTIIYKQNGKWYWVEQGEFSYTQKFDGRIIIYGVNPKGYERYIQPWGEVVYHTYEIKQPNYFSDWNNRYVPVATTRSPKQTISCVSAVNNGYKENEAGQSWCPNVTMGNICGEIENLEFKGYGESVGRMPSVNIYASKNTLPEYLFTLHNIQDKEIKVDLEGTFYYGENTAGLFYFGKLIDGEGGWFVSSGNNTYELLQKENKPILAYNTLLTIGQVDEFFVIQKQSYLIKNNIIYACIIQNGVLTNLEYVLNLGAVKYIGSTPQTAYFLNENLKMLFGFFGSAEISYLFDTYKLGKIKGVYKNLSEMGLVITTEDKVFYVQQEDIFARDIRGCRNVYFTDKGIYYLCDEGIVFETMQSDIEETEIKPLYCKTLYIGTGRNELAENNCWYITLYNRHGKENGSVKVIGRCINTSSLTQREKELHLTMQDFTEEGLCFIRFQPQVQNTVGTSIEIISDYDIQYLALGYMPQGIQQITKINL